MSYTLLSSFCAQMGSTDAVTSFIFQKRGDLGFGIFIIRLDSWDICMYGMDLYLHYLYTVLGSGLSGVGDTCSKMRILARKINEAIFMGIRTQTHLN